MPQRFGELVQWEIIGGLKGPEESSWWLIVLMDCATNRAMGRFVSHPSTASHFSVLGMWLRTHGRMTKCCTRRRSFFRWLGKSAEWLPGAEESAKLTQIGRALGELNIRCTASGPAAEEAMRHFSATARSLWRRKKWRTETPSLEEANEWLEVDLLPWWHLRSVVPARDPGDAHRPLEGHDLESILSDVQIRRIRPDLTIRIDRCLYIIREPDLRRQLAGTMVRVEKSRDTGLAIRGRTHPLQFEVFNVPKKQAKPTRPRRNMPGPNAGGRSRWNEMFWKKKGPSLDQAIRIANSTS